MPPRADTLKELGASKMADEALAGLDEGALRKLVSSPITVLRGGQEPSQGYRTTAFALLSAKEEGGVWRRGYRNSAKLVPFG